MAGLKKKLAQVGQEALERLELPVNIAAGVARIELLGNRELYMDRHRGVLAYTTEALDFNFFFFVILFILSMRDRGIRDLFLHGVFLLSGME